MAISLDNKMLLAQMGLGLGAGLLNSRNQQRQNREDKSTSLAKMIAEFQQRENENSTASTQLDPLAHQRSRAGFSEYGDVISAAKPVEMNFDPTTGFGSLKGGMAIPEGGFSSQTKGFYSPEAMANAEAEFYGAAGTPYDLSRQYGSAANGASELLAQRLASRQDPTAILREQLAQQQPSAQQAQQKKGGGFWRTLGKIGAIAAPIVAAPFTGGASLALIGAAAGAANAKLNGAGWKGTLAGAGMGAIPGMGGGGDVAKRAVGQSVGSALKNAVLNPRALTTIGSAALPDQAGAVARLAAMVLPGANKWRTPPTMGRLAPLGGGYSPLIRNAQLMPSPFYDTTRR